MVTGAGNTSRGLRELYLDFNQYENPAGNYGLRLNVNAGGTAVYDNGAIRLGIPAADDDASASATTATIWRPSDGDPLILEGRIRNNGPAAASVFFGLAQSNQLGVVIEYEDGVLNSVAVDAVGFLLEGEQDLTWNRINVKANVDGALAPLGHDAFDAQANRHQRLSLVINESGDVKFYIDGELQSEDFVDDLLRPNMYYCAILSTDGRAPAATNYTHLDEIYLCQPRPR